MLNPELFGRLPLSSADSTNVCRNVQLDSKWIGPYAPNSKRVRGLVLVDRIESHNAAPVWSGKAAYRTRQLFTAEEMEAIRQFANKLEPIELGGSGTGRQLGLFGRRSRQEEL
jgi:hypothetical protein